MATSDSIGELCVALAHRWEPERVFMILTGYFDESGTHGAELMVMAGYVADARQWRNYEKRTTKLFRRFRVDQFHAIDVRRSDGCFAGWTVDRKLEFEDEFQHVINESLETGVVALISREDYAWYKALERPPKARTHSKYALLFRAVFAFSVERIIDVPRWAERSREPSFNTVLEQGHKNSGEAVWFYDAVSKMHPHKALSGLTFQDKRTSLPLAAADMLAYSAFVEEMGTKKIGVMKKPSKSDKSYRGELYRVPLTRGVLTQIHEQAVMLASQKALS